MASRKSQAANLWAVAAVYVLFLIAMFFPPSVPERLLPFSSNTVFQLIIGLLAVLAALISGAGLRSGLMLNRPRWRHLPAGLFLWVSAFILMNLLLSVIGYFFPDAVKSAATADAVIVRQGLFAAILLSAALPAICEELLFRGFMLARLNRGMPVAASAAICAVLFALSHRTPAKMLPIFLLGLALGLAGGLSRSVYIPMAMHFANNLAVILAAFYPQTADRVRELLFGRGSLVSLLIAIISALAGMLLLRKRSRA